MEQTWRKRLTALALLTSLVASLPLYADESDDITQDNTHEAKTSSLTVAVSEGETTIVTPEATTEATPEAKTVTTDAQNKAIETLAPSTEQKKSTTITGSSLTPVEVVNTEETGNLSGNKTANSS